MLLTVLHHTPDPEKVLLEAMRVSKRVIIIEDVYSNKVQQYMTYAMDTLVNLGHSSMTYTNKNVAEWRAVFQEQGWTLKKATPRRVLLFFTQMTYVIEHEE